MKDDGRRKEDRKFWCSLACLITSELVSSEKMELIVGISTEGHLKLVEDKTKAGLTGENDKGESWEYEQLFSRELNPRKRQNH